MSPSFAKFSCHISCSCYCKHIGCCRDTCICRCELFAFCRIMQTFSQNRKKTTYFLFQISFCIGLLKKCSLLVTYFFWYSFVQKFVRNSATKSIVHKMVFKKSHINNSMLSYFLDMFTLRFSNCSKTWMSTVSNILYML